MKMIAALVGVLLPMVVAAAPDVRVQARLVPTSEVLVGGSINLEVDLLVDTWFTAAPVLPRLELPGAVVTPPGGEAQHLNEQLDGKAFFGLRYRYVITPQVAQPFAIPGLLFQVQPGQADGPVQLSSSALSFVAKAPAGATDNPQLVASRVTFGQAIARSHEPLRVGDSITRTLTITAEGAQAMLVPPPPLEQVEGLQRYVQTPKVSTLSDGRGGVLGGQREDTASYVISRPGAIRLPAVELTWWDVATGTAHRVSVRAVEAEVVETSAAAAPFSITEDLRNLGQQARVRLSGYWLAIGGCVLSLLVVARLLVPHLPVWRGRLKRWSDERNKQRLASARFAWALASRELSQQPPQLSAFYLGVRRTSGQLTVAKFSQSLPDAVAKPLLASLHAPYSKAPRAAGAVQTLAQLVPVIRRAGAARNLGLRAHRHGLKSLNP